MFVVVEANQEVGVSGRNQRRVNLSAEAQMGFDRPAPLGHAMDLRFLDVVAGVERGPTTNLRGLENPLPSDSSKCDTECPVLHERCTRLSFQQLAWMPGDNDGE